jgi:hypothetical protein
MPRFHDRFILASIQHPFYEWCKAEMLVRMYVRCAQQHGCNQLVQVPRTGVEKGNPDAVPDADLNEFMAAALAARSGATRSEASAQAR